MNRFYFILFIDFIFAFCKNSNKLKDLKVLMSFLDLDSGMFPDFYVCLVSYL